MPKGVDKRSPTLSLGDIVTGPTVTASTKGRIRTVCRTGESATGVLVRLTAFCEGFVDSDPDYGTTFTARSRIPVAEVRVGLRTGSVYIPLTHLVVLPPDTDRNQFGTYPNGLLVPVIHDHRSFYTFRPDYEESALWGWTKPDTRWLAPFEHVWGPDAPESHGDVKTPPWVTATFPAGTKYYVSSYAWEYP